MSRPSSSSFHGSDVRGDDFTPAIDRRSMQRLEGHELIKALNVKYTPGAQPLLVLSHGFGCDKSVWHKVISNLRDSEIHSGILTYDLAFSCKVGKDYYQKYSERYQTIDGYVEDIVSILQYYNIHTCIFVGHSTSGLVGLQASIRHRDLFSQLVLIGTAPCALEKFPDYMIGYSRERADERLKLMEVDYKKFVETYIEIALPGNTKDNAKLKLNNMLSRTTGDVVKSMATMVFNTDLRPMLPLVTSPCTIISTSANTVASTFAQNYMMQQMKNARITLVEVKTKGHLPHLTAGKMVAKHITDVIHEWITRTEPLTSIPPSLLPSYDRLHEEIRVLKEENMLLKRENEALKKPAIDETTKLATVSRPGGGSHESSPASGGS